MESMDEVPIAEILPPRLEEPGEVEMVRHQRWEEIHRLFSELVPIAEIACRLDPTPTGTSCRSESSAASSRSCAGTRRSGSSTGAPSWRRTAADRHARGADRSRTRFWGRDADGAGARIYDAPARTDRALATQCLQEAILTNLPQGARSGSRPLGVASEVVVDLDRDLREQCPSTC